jgi:hypothetical protein
MDVDAEPVLLLHTFCAVCLVWFSLAFMNCQRFWGFFYLGLLNFFNPFLLYFLWAFFFVG